MELLVATWTIRLTLVAMLVVGWVSLNSGLGMLDVVLRVGVTALVLSFAGKWLMGYLETPEQKLARLRAQRLRKRGER
jgi:hypothetical protein